MILTNDILIRIAIFVLGACGFAVAKHIHNHKKPESGPLVCPMNMDCHGVVHSDYSTFLGVNLEIWGMIFYGVEILLWSSLIFVPTVILTIFAIVFASTGFLFSVYLVVLLLFVLKKGCFWCFVSAGISTLIFICTAYLYGYISMFLSLIK